LSITEVSINVNTRKWTLNQAGALNGSGATAGDNGVTGQALYSFFKEEWRINAENFGAESPPNADYLIKHPFPMLPLTREQYEFGNNGSQFNGWLPSNDTTRQFLRTCGWAEYDAAATLLREYAGVITLGGPNDSDQVYYENQVATPTDFVYPGPVNEAIQIYGNADNGNFTRKTLFNVYVREAGLTYNRSSIGDIGVTTMETIVNRFPLAVSTDANWDVYTDFNIGNAPYVNMSITYYESAQSRSIDSVSYDFRVVIDAATGDRYQVYNFVQYQQRQNADIDDGSPGTIDGKTSQPLVLFDGTTLITQYVDETVQRPSPPVAGGVWIDDYDVNDKNDIQFTDDTQTVRSFNFVSAGTLQFNSNLVTDNPNAKYWVYFEYTNTATETDVSVGSITSPYGATISSTNLDFTLLENAEQFTLTGFTNPENNGVWEVTTSPPGGNSVDAIKIRDEDGINLSTPVAEGASASVTFRTNPYGTSSALLVQDSSPADISGTITTANIAFDFAYGANTQGGRTADTVANCICIAIGRETGQYIEAPFTITESTGITVPVNANRERVYNTV